MNRPSNSRDRWIWLLLALGALIFIAPILFMVIGSLKPDQRVLADAASWRAFVPIDASLQNYRDVFARVSFARFLFNSILITGAIVVAGSFVNSMAAYAFARLRWPGRDLCFHGVLALMILPYEAIAIPLFHVVTSLGWRDTYIAQYLPFTANAFSIYLFYSFFLGLPRELEEAARCDGAGTFRIFWQIVVPNSRPVFATVVIVNLIFFWGFYLWPLMVTSGPAVRPLPVAIASFQTLPPLAWGDLLAFGVMMVAPVLVTFVFFQRFYIQGIATAGLKG